MAANFTIENRARAIQDIQRSWLFEVSFPRIADIVPIASEEGLLIRARTCSIPGRTNEHIESVFMGTKQVFPGKENFSNTLEVTFEDSEDQYIFKALYAWKNKIFNPDPEAEFAGSSEAERKRAGMVTDGFLKMYKFGRQAPTEKWVRFYNMYPSDIADVALTYDGNESIKYSVTFKYDLWTLFDAQ